MTGRAHDFWCIGYHDPDGRCLTTLPGREQAPRRYLGSKKDGERAVRDLRRGRRAAYFLGLPFRWVRIPRDTARESASVVLCAIPGHHDHDYRDCRTLADEVALGLHDQPHP